MYRLYNPNSGEHFLTGSSAEKDTLIHAGWRYEGISWKAPTEGAPIYRLYNPNAGDHHYTGSTVERDMLVSVGWHYEGVSFCSADSTGKPVYRLYNPNCTGAGAHHYTGSQLERDYLVSLGWNYEGISWSGIDVPTTEENYIASELAGTDTASRTDQIIVVSGHTLSMYRKNAGGSWNYMLGSYCGYGRNGLAYSRNEGDGTTPIGSFRMTVAFGTGANPGTAMTYRQITPYSYWSAAKNTYNTWVESSSRIAGEHLADYPTAYKYAIDTGYNAGRIYQKGSAIFLHCKSQRGWTTAGCVCVPENVMLRILRESKDGQYIMIVTDDASLAAY